MDEVNQLQKFLCSAFSTDVLMPVIEGTKRPMFKHKENAWTWKLFDSFLKNKEENWFHKNPNVCVILHDLCVIDVDTEEKAKELEAKFPILLTVPCEKTKRGIHYWFTRSATADVFGYYDGAAQIEKDVDFKSVHSTGTGGIVVIAPSKDKTWTRPLWTTFVPEIPDDLLEAVAVPALASIDATLQFENGQTLTIHSCKWLQAIAYFAPFLDGSLDNHNILVPCDKDIFQELVNTMDKNEIGTREPSLELFKKMLVVADKLGLSTKMTTRLSCGKPALQFDTFNMCHDWWYAYHQEREWCSQGAKRDDGFLIDVDFELSSKLLYEPLKRDERWLFSGLKPCGVPEGVGVLQYDPLTYVWSNLPEVVWNMMNKYKKHLVLAGGAVLGLVSPHVELGADYDFFVVGLTPDQASIMLNDIIGSCDDNSAIIRTERALTIVFKNNEIAVQIIMRTHECVGQVLSGFDLPPCKIAAWIDDQSFYIKCAPTWIPCMKHMAFPVDTATWGRASPLRILKYYKKGFDVFVPCNYLDARNDLNNQLSLQAINMMSDFRMRFRRWIRPEIKVKPHGLMALFQAEQEVLRIHDRKKDQERITEEEFQMCVREMKYISDYGGLARFQHRLGHIISSFVNGIAWFTNTSLERPDPDDMEEDKPFVWRTADPTKKCMGMFNPSDPGMREVFDTTKFASHLELNILTHDIQG